MSTVEGREGDTAGGRPAKLQSEGASASWDAPDQVGSGGAMPTLPAATAQGPTEAEDRTSAARAEADELLAQLERQDRRIHMLTCELQERQRRISVLESALQAAAVPCDPSPTLGTLQVFWTAGGTVTEAGSIKRLVREDGSVCEWLVPIPAESEGPLRIDPGNRPGFWEVLELAVFGVDADGTMEQSPRAVCDAAHGFDGLQLRTGLLRLASGEAGRSPAGSAGGNGGNRTVSGGLRLYVHTDDPQLHWPEATAKGPCVVRVRVRALGLLRGLMTAEAELFHGLLKTALAESSARERHWHEGVTRLSAELAALRDRHQQLSGELHKARQDAALLSAQLERITAERTAVLAQLDRFRIDHADLLQQLGLRTTEAETFAEQSRLLALQLEEARRASESMAGELAVVRRAREQLVGELASARQAEAQAARTAEARRRALNEASSALAAARRQLEQAARTAAELAALRARAAETTADAPRPPDPAPADADRHHELLERLEDQRQRLAAEYRALREQRASFQQRHEELARELDSLRRAIVAERYAKADAERARHLEAQRAAQSRFSQRLARRLRRVLGLSVKSPEAASPPDGLTDPFVRAMFDAEFYSSQWPETTSIADPLAHYLSIGWLAGADPHPLFSTRWYRERYSDVASAGVCPLVHYARHGGREGRDPHPLFDTRYYLHVSPAAQAACQDGTPPLVHYLQTFDACPQPLFDERFYLHTYPDVARAGLQGFLHFCRYGHRERRQPHPLFDSSFYLDTYPDVAEAGLNPLTHYVARGSAERRNPHPLFDTAFYLQQSPGVDASGLSALDHYLRWGWKLGRRPHPWFDPAFYLRENPDVASKGLEPLTHFVQFGWREHRDPCPDFDVRFYLLANPDVAREGINPLVHLLRRQPATRQPGTDDQRRARPLGELVVLTSGLTTEQAALLEAASPHVRVLDARTGAAVADEDYVHAPTGEGLTAGELRNVALLLAHQAYDFVVVSRGIAPDRVVACSADDALVLSGRLHRLRRAGKPFPAGTTGRLVRLLGSPSRQSGLREISFEELGLGPLAGSEGELVVLGPATAKPRRVPRREVTGFPVSLPRSPASTRPLVWAMPMMLAVGGVERNMVGLLREIHGKDDGFDFLVVTTERLRPEQGSLHHQTEAVSLGVIDLGELAPPDLHLDLLTTLKRCTRPAAVWLCNGTPWLADHAHEFRTLLADTALIDQQVYDAETGWITYFDRVEAFRQADRYIAINARIRPVLIERYGIDPGRVDLIYHLIDDERFRRRVLSDDQRRQMRRRWGLPESGELYAQVGRLTDQKQPLAFLELARRARDAGSDSHFVLVGSGELADACDRFIAETALTNVTRIPFVEDMSELLPALTALVMCSKYEGLPVVILESLALGVPVLSTDVGDVRLVLESYGNGRVVGAGESMFDAWVRFRDDLPDLQAVAGQRADEVRERFSRSSAARAYVRCIRDAIAHRRGLSATPHLTDAVALTAVIPTFNRADTLERTLRTALRYAAGLPVEFVVVDDGSRDRTPEVLERIAQAAGGRMIVRRVDNGGPGRARNLAATLARGGVLLFMGDDTEPESPAFFTTHLDLHLRQPARGFSVLGKMVWPDDPEADVNFVMQHIQGHGGEQFGYADLTPYAELDWRFFYTANLSVKRSLVDDWMREGFSPAFRFAAWEDNELAYRMSRRSGADRLRLVYAPTALGYHHHPYTVDQFIQRQLTAGQMLRVMLELHPELTEQLLPPEIRRALEEPPGPAEARDLPDLLATIEGIKAWARLIDRRRQLGRVAWHRELLYGVFELAMYEGYLLSERRPDRNVARALHRLVDRCIRRAQASLQHELLGYRLRSNRLVPTA